MENECNSSRCIFCHEFNFSFGSKSSSSSSSVFHKTINSWTNLLDISPESTFELDKIFNENPSLSLNKISCEKCQFLIENGEETLELIKKIQNELEEIKNKFKMSIQKSVNLNMTSSENENRFAGEKVRQIILKDMGFIIAIKEEKIEIEEKDEEDNLDNSTIFDFTIKNNAENTIKHMKFNTITPIVKIEVDEAAIQEAPELLSSNSSSSESESEQFKIIQYEDQEISKKLGSPRKFEIENGNSGSDNNDDDGEEEEGNSKKAKIIRNRWIFPDEDFKICNICQKSFTVKKNYFSHKFRHHGGEKYFNCEICNEMFGTDWLYFIHQRDVHNKSDKKFSCNLCEKVYLKKVNLKKHISEAHSGPRQKIKCKYCDSSFLTYRYLKEHEKGHLNPFHCKICNSDFNTKIQLKSHISIKHSESEGVDPQKFQCSLCNYGSNSKSGFELHMTSHSDIRDCICNFCGMSFKREALLDRHMKIKHQPDSEKEYKCNHCPKGFINKRSLERHFLTHKSNEERLYKCNFCNKRFNSKTNLKHHESTHGEKRNFNCNFCSKSFTNHAYLKSHIYHVHEKKKKI